MLKRAAWVAIAAGLFASPAVALETVRFRDDDQVREVTGRVLASDSAGGVYLQSDDGAVWLALAEDVISRSSDDREFVPVTAKEMSDRLLDELPSGFQIYRTKHYVMAYRTSREFAKWTASMLERLHRAFVNYWERQGFELDDPEFPLVVIVYADAQNYAHASAPELGGGAGNVVGYYSLLSNRVTMFDLSGQESLRGGNNRRATMKEINQMLRHPAAVPMVSTIVHEATHQIAFNIGLQQRMSDLPLWLVEGMAVYFEAPDLSSGRGWRGIGKVNYPRLRTFRQNIRRWGPGSLAALISTDKRLRGRGAAEAYADAWALNYYLIKYRTDDYVKYIRMLSEKKPLVSGDAEQRVEEFRAHFGDLSEVQQEMLKVMSRVD